MALERIAVGPDGYAAHTLLTAVPSSPPCRESARPRAASASHSRPQAPSAAWPRTPSSQNTSPSMHRKCLPTPVLAAEISALRAGLMLLQDANNLLFRQSRFIVRPLHGPDSNLRSRKNPVAGQSGDLKWLCSQAISIRQIPLVGLRQALIKVHVGTPAHSRKL